MAKLERKDKEDKAGQDERGREGRKEGRTYLIVVPQALVRLEHGLSGCLVIFAFQGLDTTEGANVFGDDMPGSLVDEFGNVVLDGIQLRGREGGREGGKEERKSEFFIKGFDSTERTDIIRIWEGGREGGRGGLHTFSIETPRKLLISGYFFFRPSTAALH